MEGNIKDLNSFAKLFEKKSNWLCEYSAIGSTLKPLLKNKSLLWCKVYNCEARSKILFFMMNSLGRKAKKVMKPYYKNKL